MLQSRLKQQPKTLSPGTQLAIRWVTLLMLFGFTVWAMMQLGQPKSWRWWSTLTPTEQTVPTSSQPRLAPFPDQAILAKLVDRTLFGVENNQLLLPNQRNEQNRHDADARYHLLLLASMSQSSWLEQDARTHVDHDQLMQQPGSFRGALLRFQGELISWSKIPLKRTEIPGQTYAYQAWIVLAQPHQRICFLFSELPKGWPDEVKPMHVRQESVGVTISGYFLKLLRVENPLQPEQPVNVPVLVGKGLKLMPIYNDRESDMRLLWLFLGMAFPVFLLLSCAWFWYGKTDASLRKRLCLVKERRQALEREALTEFGKNGMMDIINAEPNGMLNSEAD